MGDRRGLGGGGEAADRAGGEKTTRASRTGRPASVCFGAGRASEEARTLAPTMARKHQTKQTERERNNVERDDVAYFNSAHAQTTCHKESE